MLKNEQTSEKEPSTAGTEAVGVALLLPSDAGGGIEGSHRAPRDVSDPHGSAARRLPARVAEGEGNLRIACN
jgi:hypothetical protein